RKISGVLYISPELNRRFQIVTPGSNTNSTIVGVTSDYAVVHNTVPAQGSVITDANVRSIAKVVVLGPNVASDLFGETDPVGKSIRINSVSFKVIGVLETKGGSGFASPDDTVFVPLSTMQKVLVGADYLSSIAVSVENKNLMSQVQEEIFTLLSQKHRVEPENADFSIISQADILGTLNQITTTLTIFLASVAGISLLVGGIGIMNMMLTTVTERTREIGLRKAIGARKRDISLQFLAESILLTFIGGVIGIILGWLISFAVSSFAGIDASVSLGSVVLAFGVSAGIGIIFGYYPARRAASLNPIEALRYE
ncbi:MAG: FtsX-like permease family protein, partial [Patescibacteria group bacterium]|nr:FtsX-like permease family protein [Patescibacteria group bacterium]